MECGSSAAARSRRHLDVSLAAQTAADASAADASAAAAAAAASDSAAAALKHVFVIQSFSSRERRAAKHGGWRVRSMGGPRVCAACAHTARLLLMFNRLSQPR